MSVLQQLQPYKFRLLLTSLFAMSIISPLTDHFQTAHWIYIGLIQLALLSSLIAVLERKRRFVISLVLGVLAFGSVSLEYAETDASIHIAALVLLAIFFAYLACVFLSDVLRSKSIDSEQICGALCVYLLIGIVWTFLYGMVLYSDPNAIQFPENSLQERSSRLTYFSFVTLTTLGYGDIHPLTSQSRTLCWVEAVLGQIYLTVLVARLVGLNLSQSFAERE